MGTRKMVRIEPQPVKIADAGYPGEGMWEFNDEIYMYDSLLQSYLFHDVYGSDIANRLDEDEDAEPVVIDYVWYWRKA